MTTIWYTFGTLNIRLNLRFAYRLSHFYSKLNHFYSKLNLKLKFKMKLKTKMKLDRIKMKMKFLKMKMKMEFVYAGWKRKSKPICPGDTPGRS